MSVNPSLDLDQVKSIIESRTKFLSLSGLSGVLAGSYALLGSYVAYHIIYKSKEVVYYDLQNFNFSNSVLKLFAVAVTVFLAALLSSYIHSKNKAKKRGKDLWSKAAFRMLSSFLIPLITGGIFIIFLLFRKELDLIAPSCLIFYGLALVSASHYTYSDLKLFGIAQIILGLVNMMFVGLGLYFWAVGFGVFHIIYGWIMYYKYDRLIAED